MACTFSSPLPEVSKSFNWDMCQCLTQGQINSTDLTCVLVLTNAWNFWPETTSLLPGEFVNLSGSMLSLEISMLQVHPLTSHCPTLSAHAEPTSQNVAPRNIFMSSTDGYIQESVNFRAFHMPLFVHHFDLQTLELWLSVMSYGSQSWVMALSQTSTHHKLSHIHTQF